MQLFEVGSFATPAWTYNTPAGQTGNYPIFITSSESMNSMASFINGLGDVETHLVRDDGAGTITMTQMGIKIEKVSWIMGELVSVSRQGAPANSGDTLIDLSNAQIVREPIKTDIVNKRCAWFGNGKVLCLTSQTNRYALYLPRVGDLSVAIDLGIDGDIISPYKFDFDLNPGDSLSSGLLIACRKVSEFEVGCDSGEVNNKVVHHSWTYGMTLEDASGNPEDYIGIYPNEHLVSFLDKTNSTLHFVSTRDGSYGENVVIDAGA
jgi:hypothetical protein